MKNTNNTFYGIRRQKRTADRKMKEYIYFNPGSKEVLIIDYNPNSINLWIRIRDNFCKENKIKCSGNNLVYVET